METKTAALRDENDKSLILPHVRDMLFDHARHVALARTMTITSTFPK